MQSPLDHLSAAGLPNRSNGPSLNIDVLSNNSSMNGPLLPINTPIPDSDKALLIEQATNAMEELLVLLQTDDQLWIKSMYEDKEIIRKIDHQYLGVIQNIVHSSMTFGDQCLLATLQRLTEHQNMDIGGVVRTQESKRSMMTLSHGMVKSFCSNLCPANEIQIRVSPHNIADNVEPNGIILKAVTSTWLPFSTDCIYCFFKDESKRVGYAINWKYSAAHHRHLYWFNR